jgi:hypothetical protein
MHTGQSNAFTRRERERIMTKNNKRILCFSVAVLSVLTLAAVSGLRAAPEQTPTEPQVLSNAVVNEPIQFDVTPPLAELVTGALGQQEAQQDVRLKHAPMAPKLHPLTGAQPSQGTLAGALQPSIAPLVSATIGLSFEGVGNTSTLNCPSVAGFTVAPPDTNAAVGDTQVVQWVNVCYAVFDKSTGALIAGPLAGNNFWKGFGGTCETSNDGDIIIQWDKRNHRWVASQNVFSTPYMTCIAISQTADATGGYFRYAFPQAGFPDYPKWGLTRRVYYQTQNDFGSGVSFRGVNVCAYDAALMLRGSPKATQVCILDDSDGTLFDDSMLPADDDSDSGTVRSEVLLGSIDNFLPGDTHVYEYVFKVDFKHPANSTLAGVNGSMPISVPAFNLALCVSGTLLTPVCVPQPDTTDRLDTLGDRLMYRLAHFVDNRGRQHFLVAHSVNNSTATAVRWYEFQARGEGSTSLSLHQSGQTPDDGHYRWMGSAAMDKRGDIAIGYSRSSAASGDYPSIYYAGHKAGDHLGTTRMGALIKQGSGSQTDTGGRWGDYSSMALDGSDSCTFWYTTEYYPATGRFAWATWVASLKFPNCDREERKE